MAIDVNLNNIQSGYNVSQINENFNSVQEAFQDALSRSGVEPNQLNADLDMNSNDIINVNSIDVNSLTIGGVDILNNPDIEALAAIVAEIGAVAGITTDVTTVAGIADEVTIVADNIDDINNFSDIWQGAKLTPPTLRNDGTALQAGDMYFDLVTSEPNWYTGGAWTSISEQGLQLADKSFVGDGVQTDFTLDVSPATGNNILVWVGGVRQRPETDYTVSGTTLTITTAPGNTIGVDTLVLAKTTEILVPADGSVGTTQLADGAVTKPKLAADSVDASKIDGADAAAIRTKIGALSSATPVPVANGGTGAATAAAARTNLGLVIGTDVQAQDAQLAAIAGLSPVSGDFIRWAGGTTAVAQAIEGTVSKSASTVTGAIYETGSNANGYYIKFGNGVMLQWHEISATPDAWTTATGSFFIPAAPYVWTFPQAFTSVSGMMVMGQVRRNNNAYVSGTNINTYTTTTADVMPWTNVSLAASASKLVALFAIGYWG